MKSTDQILIFYSTDGGKEWLPNLEEINKTVVTIIYHFQRAFYFLSSTAVKFISSESKNKTKYSSIMGLYLHCDIIHRISKTMDASFCLPLL